VDVTWKIWYICIGDELHLQQLGTMPYYNKHIQGSWNIRNYYGFTTERFIVHFDLCEKIITYVKDEGVNLNTFKST